MYGSFLYKYIKSKCRSPGYWLDTPSTFFDFYLSLKNTMEELQSTEILDREILEDARKKAQRILKAADDAIKAKEAERERNIRSALGELEEKYKRQTAAAAKEIMAVLPIDKRRLQARKIEELLNIAVESWYAKFSRQRALETLQRELEKRLAACETFTGVICTYIHKIETDEAAALLREIFPGRQCAIEKIASVSAYPEITVEAGGIRIHASVGKAANFILGKKRSELIEALFGKAAFTEIAGGELC
jgi:vacuolar-type H+-ATPase subunit E/Vma4